VLNNLDTLTETLIEHGEKSSGQPFFAVIAKLCHGSDALAPAYADAMGVIREYDAFSPVKPVAFVEEIGETCQLKPLYSIEQERQLLGNVQVGNTAGTEAILEEIFSVCREGDISAPSIENLFHQLVGSVYRVVERQNDRFESQTFISDLIGKINTANDLEDNITLIRTLFLKIAEFNEREKADQKMEVYRQICAVIQNGYTSNLSLKSIGQALGYSPSYISWVFREMSGGNFVDYVNNCRITYAKELLGATQKNINEIAMDVGYINANTFIKRFKKQEGLTPGQYRIINT
jgi:YesN/AraC family two-component response regulator